MATMRPTHLLISALLLLNGCILAGKHRSSTCYVPCFGGPFVSPAGSLDCAAVEKNATRALGDVASIYGGQNEACAGVSSVARVIVYPSAAVPGFDRMVGGYRSAGKEVLLGFYMAGFAHELIHHWQWTHGEGGANSTNHVNWEARGWNALDVDPAPARAAYPLL